MNRGTRPPGPEEWRRAEKRVCGVCRDGQGFHARACPGCQRRKVRMPSGLVMGLRARDAEEYLALSRTLSGGGEAARG